MRHSWLGCVAVMLVAGEARADDPDVEPPTEATIPVLLDAADGAVRFDEFLCVRDRCELRVTPGRHRVSREVLSGGEWTSEQASGIEVSAPMVVRVARPGLVHRISTAALLTGVALVLVGGLVPLLVCRNTRSVDPSTGQVRVGSNLCSNVSDPVKIAWIGGVGVGLTLAMLGIVGKTFTSGETKIVTRAWAIRPYLSPTARECGLGFTATF